MDKNPTQRFAQKAENYMKYRPGYPISLIDFFTKKIKGTSEDIIADIGSGTGILTELFLKNGNAVYGVEPNKEMREAGEKLLAKYSDFKSVDGTAEATKLPNRSVDFVIAGQAFHWFDVEKSKIEFNRILKPKGKILLIWNTRDDERSEFMKKYNQFLIDFSTDYQLIMHRRLDGVIFGGFYGNQKFQKVTFDNFQIFDLDGLKGRYLSCSYAYDIDHPNHEKAMIELEKLFQFYQENNLIKMWYKTEMYFNK